jgi:hypothetical protein
MLWHAPGHPDNQIRRLAPRQRGVVTPARQLSAMPEE